MDIVSFNLDHRQYDENKPIFVNPIDTEEHITKAQATTLVRQLIAGYRANGLQAGDCICVIGFSQVILPVLYLSVIGAGCRVVGGNPSYTKFELAEQFKTCDVKFVLTQQKLLPKIRAAADESTCPKILTYDDDSWKELLQHGEQDWIRLGTEEAKEEIAMYLSTSGTTGLPKFAAVSHSYITEIATNIAADYAKKSYQKSQLICLPLMHAFAAPLVIGVPLRTGLATYIPSRFDVHGFFDAIENFKITHIPMVPSMMKMLLEEPSFTTRDLSSIREILSAGAPLSSEVKNQFDSILPKAQINQLYGQTEAGWICWTRVEVEAQASPSIGKPLPGFSIKLCNPQTHEIITEPQQYGELLIDGPCTFKYYLKNPRATEESFIQINDRRYLKSGDLGYRDIDGNFFIIDRLKDLIKVRGWQVSPVEIEHIISQCPGVRDAAVIGIKDMDGPSGELPVAFVDGDVEESTIQAWITARLASYKWPSKIQYIAKIPRNPAGKVLRRALMIEV